MRLWSPDPKYLDARGLTALWREGLLAQSVLMGRTRACRNHPQLFRFRAQHDPVSCIVEYLKIVHEESVARGFQFDRARVARGCRPAGRVGVPRGQVEFEWRHLRRKLERRAPLWLEKRCATSTPLVHPLFEIVPGSVADWERL